MANVDRVNGFRPVKSGTGAPWNGQVNLYFIPASDGTAVFVGDLVKLHGSASTDGYPTVIQSAANDVSVGVVVGFLPDNVTPGGVDNGRTPNLDTPNHRTASTDRYVLVADDPGLIMEGQEDGVGGALAVTNIGQNVQVVVAAGSTVTGTSGMEVDSSTAATTSTHELRLVGFVNRPDNEIGSANAKVLVAFNKHQYGSVGTTGI
jgi:hypothetical protein